MMTMFRTSLERGTFGPATMLLKKISKPFPQVLITLNCTVLFATLIFQCMSCCLYMLQGVSILEVSPNMSKNELLRLK